MRHAAECYLEHLLHNRAGGRLRLSLFVCPGQYLVGSRYLGLYLVHCAPLQVLWQALVYTSSQAPLCPARYTNDSGRLPFAIEAF